MTMIGESRRALPRRAEPGCFRIWMESGRAFSPLCGSVPYMFRLSIIFVMIAAFALSACTASDKDRYAGRDGKVEAIKDLRAGKPLLIYSHVLNGFAPGWASPGLVSCSPDEVGGASASRVFQIIPEAAFQEGEVRSSADNQLAASALRFAKAYNEEVLRIRRADIQRVCPHVQAES